MASAYSEDGLARRRSWAWHDVYTAMTMTAVDAQLIEQLKMTAETVCSCFHVPPYMIGVGPAPTYNNIEALNQHYYSQCLQVLMEEIEVLLDEGLGSRSPTAPSLILRFAC